MLHDEQKKGGSLPAAVPAGSENAPANPAENPAGTENSPQPKDPATGTGAEPKPAETKPAEIVAEKAAPRKPENSISPRAAEYKGRIEEAISEKGLNGHVKVQAAGNTLTLAGKLHPAEHGALLKLLRNAPSDVRVIDHLEYDDTPVTVSGSSDQGTHPVPAAGRAASVSVATAPASRRDRHRRDALIWRFEASAAVIDAAALVIVTRR